MNWQDELKIKLHQHLLWKNFKAGISKQFLPEFVDENSIINFIHSLLKQQREICMKEYQKSYQKGYTEISVNIDNAKEPEDV